MKNNTKLRVWLWKWHVIAGLITLPFVLVLAITGAIYLFKADYEAPQQRAIKEVSQKFLDVPSSKTPWGIANGQLWNQNHRAHCQLDDRIDTHRNLYLVARQWLGYQRLFCTKTASRPQDFLQGSTCHSGVLGFDTVADDPGGRHALDRCLWT